MITPGKWLAGLNSEECTIATMSASMERKLVAILPLENFGLETTMDNARLIAAAPELLEACKTVKKWMDSFHTKDSTCSQLLELAIAKAEGKL